ncbi:anti-sigma factor family protein [Actinokineospora sp.]|uniref:anti-sigma factor family protein n=1 Tax=Actinokineospora sp. TaxID=1872133 RepID=UPI004038095D
MSAPQHNREQLGAYVLGALDPREAQAVRAHLANCPDCRREVADLAALRGALDEIPPEAFLDGPPDNDLVLQRTLRRMSAQAPPRRSRALVAAGVAVLAAITLGGGFVVGRGTAPDTGIAAPVPSNARIAEATDPDSGAVMAVRLVPQGGWVRVNVTVKGAPTGARCLLRVVPRTGDPVVAGSWLVSEKGSREGTTLDGAALVDPAEVAAVDVVTTDGQKIVSVRL